MALLKFHDLEAQGMAILSTGMISDDFYLVSKRCDYFFRNVPAKLQIWLRHHSLSLILCELTGK